MVVCQFTEGNWEGREWGEMAGNAGVSKDLMSVRDLKLDTTDKDGGESEEQREKAISQKP